MRKRARSAKTGKFTTAKYAKTHPNTTVMENRKTTTTNKQSNKS